MAVYFGNTLEIINHGQYLVNCMSAISTLSFSIEVFGEYEPAVYAIIPRIDSALLTELITSFEGEQCFKPAGGYGGLVPEFFNYGPLDRYFMGQFEPGSPWEQLNGIYILGCDCGEVGCWPLVCRVRLDGNSVVWENFKQPDRLERDYSNFGPFKFNAQQYRDVVTDLQTQHSIQQHHS